jgi:hypothetical protein
LQCRFDFLDGANDLEHNEDSTSGDYLFRVLEQMESKWKQSDPVITGVLPEYD